MAPYGGFVGDTHMDSDHQPPAAGDSAEQPCGHADDDWQATGRPEREGDTFYLPGRCTACEIDVVRVYTRSHDLAFVDGAGEPREVPA